MFQTPAYLTKARHLFDYISFTVYRSPYCHTVLSADGRVHTVTCVRLFLSFSSHKFLHLFTFAHPFFFSPSSGSFLFFIAIFLYSHLYAHLFYPQLYSSTPFMCLGEKFWPFDLCERYHCNTLQKFNVVLLRAICSHFEIPVKLRDKKQILIDKLLDVISDCQCVSQ